MFVISFQAIYTYMLNTFCPYIHSGSLGLITLM